MRADEWLTAFLLTQAIEVPVYLFTARALPWMRRSAYAFGASVLTHPVVWFCLPWERAPYALLFIAAEIFAITLEGAWGRLLSAPRPWAASLLANAASVVFGSAIQWMLGGA